MRIAILVYSLNGIGGIAKHSLCLSRELADMGHKVSVWSVDYNKEQCYPELTKGLNIGALRHQKSPETYRILQLPGIRMLAYLWSLIKYFQNQRKLISVMPGGYDVVNAHGNTISWAAAAYRRRYRIPVVWLCNDFWPPANQSDEAVFSIWNKAKNSIKESLCYPFDRYDQKSVREIDKIAVLSGRVKSQMQAYYGVDPVIVRTGVESSRFAHGDGQRIRKHYSISNNCFLLLTVCMPMPRRRLEDVILAVRILVDDGIDIKYLIVGRTSHSPAYVEFIRKLVDRHNVRDRVIFAGEVSEEDLVNCYHASDAFVWASDDNQSWGLAVMEAMAAGKAVIVSDANGFAEILEDGKTALLVPSHSPAAIADAVKRLMRESAMAKSIGLQGIQLMREKYSWRNHAESMLALFREAMGAMKR